MKHFASPRFWEAYDKLPLHIRKLADKNFEILKSHPENPNLRLKKVGVFWSARVGGALPGDCQRPTRGTRLDLDRTPHGV